MLCEVWVFICGYFSGSKTPVFLVDFVVLTSFFSVDQTTFLNPKRIQKDLSLRILDSGTFPSYLRVSRVHQGSPVATSSQAIVTLIHTYGQFRVTS